MSRINSSVLAKITLLGFGILCLNACGGFKNAPSTDASSSNSTPSPSPTPGPSPLPNPGGNWVNVTFNLSGLSSECGNMSFVSSKPDEDLMIAGIAQQGLWGSSENGSSWHRLGQGAGSDIITNRTSSIVYDPVRPGTFWESGIYNGAGVYQTTDNGITFHAGAGTFHNDLVSVDFTDPNRQTILAGSHEQSQRLLLSTNGGASFTDIGANIPGGTNFSIGPLVIDSQTFLLGLSGYAGGTSGIMRSTNRGQSWAQVTSSGGFGAPFRASDGSIYWFTPWNGELMRSTDLGVSFTQATAPGKLSSINLVEFPDGKIASAGGNAIMVSSNHGGAWTTYTAQMPYTPNGIAYSARHNAIYIWHFSCGNGSVPVPPDAIMRFDLH